MSIPMIVRWVPPAVPPLGGVTDSIRGINISMKNDEIALDKLRRRRWLWGV